MSDSTTKIFTVTGQAATSIGGTRKRKRRSTARTETMKIGHESSPQKGGVGTGVTLQIEANRAPGNTVEPPPSFKNSSSGDLAKTTTESAPAPTTTTTTTTKGGGVKLLPIQNKPPPLAQEGGAKPVKVILEKKKKTTRVVFSPTKVKKLNPLQTQPTGAKTHTHTHTNTRKVAKKIRMSLNGFGKRVTRANNIRVQAKKSSLEELKKTLVEAKLIKETSKAPESVLRQMYSDYMMLKNRAL